MLQLVLFYFSFISFSDGGVSDKQNSIVGKWKTVQNNLVVEVYKHNKEYKAKIVWFKNTEDNLKPIEDWVDEKNPAKELRNRKVLGMDILHGMTYNQKDHRWENGKIYDTSSGREYSSSAWFQDDKLMVRGFWKVEFLGKTLVFERAMPGKDSL